MTLRGTKRKVCSVPGCPVTSHSKGFTLFAFPEDSTQRKKWKRFCTKEGNSQLSEKRWLKNPFICCCHFKADDISGVDSRKKLKEGALPKYLYGENKESFEHLYKKHEPFDSSEKDILGSDSSFLPGFYEGPLGDLESAEDIGMMQQKIRLQNSISPYTNREVLSGFKDVQLLSKDGYNIGVNKSVLIANCRMLGHQILEADKAGEEVTISTELQKAELERVVTFFLSGLIPNENMPKSNIEAFQYFGIDLQKLSFTKVPQSDYKPICAEKNLWSPSKPEVTIDQESTVSDSSKPAPIVINSLEALSMVPGQKEGSEIVSLEKQIVKKELDSSLAKSLVKTNYSSSEEDLENEEDDADDKDFIDDDPVSNEESSNDEDSDDDNLSWNSDEDFEPPKKKSRSSKKASAKRLREEAESKKRNYTVGKAAMAKIIKQIDNEELERALERKKSEANGEDVGPKESEDDKSKRLKRRKNQLIHQANSATANKDIIAKIRSDPKLLAEFPQDGKRNYDLKFQCPLCLFGAPNFGSMMAHSKRHKIAMEGEQMMYTCGMCQEPMKNKAEMERHYRASHPDWMACPECSEPIKISESFMDYIKHMKEVHNLDKGGVCAHCGFSCKDKCRMRKHLRETGPNHKINKCVQCDFEYKTWEEHRGHVEEVHGNVWKFRCGYCDDIADSWEEAKAHKRAEHPEQIVRGKQQKKTTCCYICGKEVGAMYLQVHLKTVHSTGEESFLCSMCPKILKSSSQLSTHMRLTHLYANKYKCDQCDKAFSLKANLNDHKINMHTANEDKPFRCEEPGCGLGFSNVHHLNDHKIKHSKVRSFQCHFCDVKFKRPACRKQHETKFHPNGESLPYRVRAKRPPNPDAAVKKKKAAVSSSSTGPKPKPVENGPCPHCGKTFRDPTNLKNHIFNKHTPDDQKPHQCPHCPKGFGTKNHLETHINSHTNSRPFKCHICQSAFNALSQRNRHVKQVHKETPEPYRSGGRLVPEKKRKRKKGSEEVEDKQQQGQQLPQLLQQQQPLLQPPPPQQLVQHQQPHLPPPTETNIQHSYLYSQM